MTTPPIQTHDDAMRFLLEFVDYEKVTKYKYDMRTFNLGRVEELMAAVGHPQRAFRSIHIAGTKGKGSTATMAQSILTAAGFRTGLYTSPHLSPDRGADDRGRRDDAGGGVCSDCERTGAVHPPAARGAPERVADVLRARHRRGLPPFRPPQGGAGGGGSRHGRPARRDERHPAGGQRDHARGLRPRGAPRPHARPDRVREGGHHQAGRAGRLRAAGAGGAGGRRRRSPSGAARPACGSARITGSRTCGPASTRRRRRSAGST